MEQLTKIKSAIKKGRLEVAFKNLDDCFTILEENKIDLHIRKHLQNEFLQLSARYHFNNKNGVSNLSKEAYLEINRNKIIKAILGMTNEIEEIIKDSERSSGNGKLKSAESTESKVGYEITLDEDYDNFSEQRKHKFLEALAKILETNPSELKITRKSKGSVKLTIELTKEQALKLNSYLNRNKVEGWKIIDFGYEIKEGLVSVGRGYELQTGTLSLSSGGGRIGRLNYLLKEQPNYLAGRDLSGQDLMGLDLSNANLSNTNFSNSNLQMVDLSGAKLDYTIFDRAYLGGANLSYTKLVKTSMIKTNLRHANIEFAAIHASKFEGSSFIKASLRNTVLMQSNFFNCNMRYVDFSEAHLQDVDFTMVNFDSAIFANTSLNEINFTEAIGLTPKQLNAASTLNNIIDLPFEFEGKFSI